MDEFEEIRISTRRKVVQDSWSFPRRVTTQYRVMFWLPRRILPSYFLRLQFPPWTNLNLGQSSERHVCTTSMRWRDTEPKEYIIRHVPYYNFTFTKILITLLCKFRESCYGPYKLYKSFTKTTEIFVQSFWKKLKTERESVYSFHKYVFISTVPVIIVVIIIIYWLRLNLRSRVWKLMDESQSMTQSTIWT